MSSKRPKGPKGGVSMFTPGGLRRTYVYLAPEVREALRKLAYDRDSSVSAVIAEAVAEYLERPRSKPSTRKP